MKYQKLKEEHLTAENIVRQCPLEVGYNLHMGINKKYLEEVLILACPWLMLFLNGAGNINHLN